MRSLVQIASPTSNYLGLFGTLDEYLLALSECSYLTKQPDSDFLAPISITDPVANYIANVMIQILRVIPQMMLHKECLPPSIHGHWYRVLGAKEPALPKPLANCMGIAQVSASQSLEAWLLLWHTVKTKQRAVAEQVCSVSLYHEVPSMREEQVCLYRAHRFKVIRLILANICSSQNTIMIEPRHS